MAGLSISIRITLYFLAHLFLTTTTKAQCPNGFQQNGYCDGESQFEQLCCTGICYWSNRAGDPACCAVGTDCRGDGGPAPDAFVAFTAVQQTTYYVETTYTTTLPQYSTVVYYSQYQTPTTTYSPPPQLTSFSTVITPAVVVVTATAAVVAPETNGVYVTVTQAQAFSAGSRLVIPSGLFYRIFGALGLGGVMLYMF